MGGPESITDSLEENLETPSEQLLKNLAVLRDMYQQDIQEKNTSMKPLVMREDQVQISDEQFFAGLELRIIEIERMSILLQLHGDDSEVQASATKMNELFVQFGDVRMFIQKNSTRIQQRGLLEGLGPVKADLGIERAELARRQQDALRDANQLHRRIGTGLSNWFKKGKALLEGEEHEDEDPPEIKAVKEEQRAFEEKLTILQAREEAILWKLKMEGGTDEDIDNWVAWRTAEDGTDNVLDEAEREYVIGLSESGNPDAYFEAYVYSESLYLELTQKILKSPKQQRDKDLTKLNITLAFYEDLGSGGVMDRAEEKIRGAAQLILENQSTDYEGVKGLVQQGHRKLMEMSITAMEAIMGDEDTLSKYVMITSAKILIHLGERTVYSDELVASVVQETMDELRKIQESFKVEPITALREEVRRIQSLPDDPLAPQDQQLFMAAFGGFSSESHKMMKACNIAHRELGMQAYMYSHGEKNSSYEPDSEMRAKLFQRRGQDIWRTMQVYSPFGVLLPSKITKRSEGAEVEGLTAADLIVPQLTEEESQLKIDPELRLPPAIRQNGQLHELYQKLNLADQQVLMNGLRYMESGWDNMWKQWEGANAIEKKMRFNGLFRLQDTTAEGEETKPENRKVTFMVGENVVEATRGQGGGMNLNITRNFGIQHMQSWWESEAWKENPNLAIAAQAGIAASVWGGALLARGAVRKVAELAPRIAGWVAKTKAARLAAFAGVSTLRVLGMKTVGSFATRASLWLAGQSIKAAPRLATNATSLLAVEIGFMAGNYAKHYTEGAEDEAILGIVEQYMEQLKAVETAAINGKTESEIYEFVKESRKLEEELRSRILVNEISKNRTLFQSVGHDLTRYVDIEDGYLNFAHPSLDRNSDANPFKGSMEEEGTLREAFIAANRKLILLGLRPFTLVKPTE